MSAIWKYRNGHWMARRWDGNQRQAKVLSARFRCIFLDNGWFRALGTSFSQALLKTQERVKTHTDAFLALKNHGVSVGSVYSNRSLERVPLLL
ncbi:hypothetical protein OU521_28260 [Escherichia coli]|nr:hypothetical protein [Escherichia coli]